MFERSPKASKQAETNEAPDPIEAKAIKHEQRRMRLMQSASKIAILLSIVGANVAEYAADVHANQELQANSIITVEERGDALHQENRDHSIVFIDGFGSVNADLLTKSMGADIQSVEDGRLLSVGYNDAPLRYENIADKIIAEVKEEGGSSVSLVGESGGGPVAMEVQERIRERSDITVDSIYLMFAPNGVAGLRPDHQDQIDLVENIKWLPGVTYSTPIRFAAELAFRSGNYTSGSLPENISNFATTANQVSNSLKEKKLPGTWLMVDQLLQIENADIKTRIENIQKAPADEVRPTIIYLGTQNDPVVNDKKSSQEIAAYARAAHLPFFSYNIPGAVHGQPQFDSAAYTKALADAKPEIQASIKKQELIANLHRITRAVPYLPSAPQSPQG